MLIHLIDDRLPGVRDSVGRSGDRIFRDYRLLSLSLIGRLPRLRERALSTLAEIDVSRRQAAVIIASAIFESNVD